MERLQLLSKVAHLYYVDNLSQQEISTRFSFSRSKVSRLLLEAREEGIVEINIATPVDRCFDLEQALKEKFGIQDAIVVPIYSINEERILDSLGKAGANYLMDQVKEGFTVGFSLGETLKAVATHLKEEQNIACEVVPIMGGNWPGMQADMDANTICQIAATRLGGTYNPLYAPAIVSNPDLKSSILEDITIQNVLAKALEADITMVSVGVESSFYAHTHLLTEDERKQLKDANVVGEVACWFYDSNGEIPDLDFHQRLVGPSILEIRENSKIVLVSGTRQKKDAIASALRGKWVDTLITDEKVAEYLLDN